MVVVGTRGQWGPPLSGLQGPEGELPWLGLPLAARQERAFLEAGTRFAETPEAALVEGEVVLVVRGDVALFKDTVAAVVELLPGLERDTSFLPSGRSGGLLQQLRLGDESPLLVALVGGGSFSEERVLAASTLEYDPKERLIEVPVPKSQLGVDLIEVPLSDRLLMPLGHWLQLLWGNMLGLAPFLWRGLAGRNIAQVAWSSLLAALRARSVDPRRVGAAMGRRGAGCRIHPSAVVEGCWLGDGVEIGANAVVRASVLADGASVEELAMVEACVLGPGARVQRLAMAKYSVLGPGSAHGGMMQLGVLDRDASVKGGTLLMDMAPGSQVQVKAAGGLFPAPVGLAGVCVGAGTVVGAGVRIAPGRAIPAGLEVIAEPSSLVQRIPEGLSGRVAVRSGTLEPLA